MDVGVSSVKSAEKAIQLAREVCLLCELGGCKKFMSNGKAALESIQPTECAVDVKAVDLSPTDQSLQKEPWAFIDMWNMTISCQP